MKRILSYAIALLLIVTLAAGFTVTAFASSSTPEATPATESGKLLGPKPTSWATPTASPKPAPIIPGRPTAKPMPTPTQPPQGGDIGHLGDFTFSITDICLTADPDYGELVCFTLQVKNNGKETAGTFPLMVTVWQENQLPGAIDHSSDGLLKPGGSAEYGFAFQMQAGLDFVIQVELAQEPGVLCEWEYTYDALAYRKTDLSDFLAGFNFFKPSVYYAGSDYDEITSFGALESYVFGPDEITAITGIVGERYCLTWEYGDYAEGGGQYLDTYYESDAPVEDIKAYLDLLMEEEGFYILDYDTDYAVIYEETGIYSLAKPSTEAGLLLYIEASWSDGGYFISVSRFVGELIFDEDEDAGLYLIYGEEPPVDADLGEVAGFRFGGDTVPSVQYVVGYRECLEYAAGEYADGYGVYMEMYCESGDPLGDMISYAVCLLEEEYYMYGGDAEFIDNSEGFFVKASADDGMFLYIELTWDEESFYIAVSKITGDIGSEDPPPSVEFDVFLTAEDADAVVKNYLITIEGSAIADGEEGQWLLITEGRCDEGYLLEYVAEGESTLIVALFDELAIYLLSPEEQLGIRFALEESELGEYLGFSDFMSGLLFIADGFDSSDLAYTGAEEICGRMTSAYSYTWGDYAYKFWIDDEFGVVLKTWQKMGGVEYVYEVTYFQIGGVEFSDMVDLDAYEITDLVY